VADPPAVPFTLHVTAGFEFPVTVAVNSTELPARTFAFVGLTVTIVDPGVPGSEGDVGLVVPPFVEVFATPPHAHATSARRSGNVCTTECFAERFTEGIALTHLEMVLFLPILSISHPATRYWTEVQPWASVRNVKCLSETTC